MSWCVDDNHDGDDNSNDDDTVHLFLAYKVLHSNPCISSLIEIEHFHFPGIIDCYYSNEVIVGDKMLKIPVFEI